MLVSELLLKKEIKDNCLFIKALAKWHIPAKTYLPENSVIDSILLHLSHEEKRIASKYSVPGRQQGGRSHLGRAWRQVSVKWNRQ